MSRTSILITLGALTILTPFSGLPASFRTFLFAIFGAGVVIVGLVERLEHIRAARMAHTASGLESAVVESEVVAPKMPITETPHGVSPI